MCDSTSFDDRIKETQDKKGILDKRKRELNYSACVQIDERRLGNRSRGSYAEVMRIYKLIDTKNGYEWLSLSRNTCESLEELHEITWKNSPYTGSFSH